MPVIASPMAGDIPSVSLPMVQPALPLDAAISTSNYGRACTNCSRAKCKCSYAGGSHICERCTRLKKLCQPLVPARRRVSRPSRLGSSTAAKQERLEQKLDSLVSLLEAKGGSLDSATSAKTVNVSANANATTESIAGIKSAPPTGQFSRGSDFGTTPSTRTESVPGLSTPATSPSYSQHDVALATTNYGDAQQALDRFRDESLQFYPFIYLPPNFNAAQLYQEFPTLWLSISAISAKTMSQLSSISDTLRKTLLDKLYVQGERNMDLLLAILHYTGWFRHHRKQAAFFNMWSGMATSLALELGLNKSTPADAAYFCYLSVWPYTKGTVKRERTMLERRAVLATFLMSSWVNLAFKRGETMKWTPHMNECLQILEQEPEWDGDKMLAYQVRAQLINEQIYESPWMRGLLDDGSKKGAPDYFIKSLNVQLQDLRTRMANLPPSNYPIPQFFLLSAELMIHEAAQELPFHTTADTTVIDTTNPPHKQVASFYNALSSIKAWLDLFFALPMRTTPDVTFGLFSQFIHCIVSLFRLSIIDDPAWDRDFVKQTVDIVQVIETFATTVEKVRDARMLLADSDEEDMFTKSAAMMRKLATAWAAEIAALSAKQNKDVVVPELEVPPELMDLDMFDSQWLTDMFLSWDH